MRSFIAHGLAIPLLIVGLGAAQGPNSSGSTNSQSATYNSVVLEVQQKVAHAKPYQIGTASWYGSDFDGKPTASGEPYDMFDLTAAHPTLPLAATSGLRICVPGEP